MMPQYRIRKLENRNVMKNTKFKLRKLYITPSINTISIDNEISLVLESQPPTLDNENFSINQMYNNDPFKNNIS